MKKTFLLALGFAMFSASVYAQPATTAKAFRILDAPGNSVTHNAIGVIGTHSYTWPAPGAGGILKSNGAGLLSLGAVNLNSGDVTGTLQFANGGTGLTTLGTAGQVLTVNGTATGLTYTTPTNGTVTSVSIGNLPPLFTASVATPTTTPAISFSLTNQAAGMVFAGPAAGVPAAPTFRALTGTDITGAALTSVNDANVTLTLGGTPATALLRSASLTLGWSGLLSIARGGTNSNAAPTDGGIAYGDGAAYQFTGAGVANQVLISNGTNPPSWANANSVVTGSALTESDDANIVVTLTGTPATALLQPVNIDVDWAGVLSLARGGTNKNASASAGSVAYSDADSYEWTAVGTSGHILRSNGAAAPTWVSANSVVTGSALTESDDANVTLTLTGTPGTALLQGVNVAAGWTGQLAINRGGTNGTAAPTAGAVAYGTGAAYGFTSAGTSGQFLQSTGAGAPTWVSGSVASAKGTVTGDGINYRYTVSTGLGDLTGRQIMITFFNGADNGLQTTYAVTTINLPAAGDFKVEFANIIGLTEKFHWIVF